MALHYNLQKIPNHIWKIDVPIEEYQSIVKEEEEKNKELSKKGKKNISLIDFNQINLEGVDKYWKLNPVTNMLIFACGLTIGIHEITEHNFLKVYNRISIWEKVFGSFIVTSIQESESNKKTSTPRPFTLQDIKDHIGLTVNVTNRFTSSMNKQEYIEKLNRALDNIDL